jgi:two-component system phosphate regulon sensor histidine kinase PhoR
MTAMQEAVIIVLDEIAGKLNKDQKQFLDIAKRNLDRLSRLIDDVLDFQKLNAGKMKFHMQANDMATAVKEAYATMQPHAAKSKVGLAIELEPSLPAVVYDADRIMQALTNLISNAIKFTPAGGRVLVSARRREEHLVLQVSDTGYGIPKEDLPKLFNQFFRVHRPGKEIKGTGLGLAIVSKIVAGHGGRIEVESELDKGTTFTVLLPLTPPHPEGETPEGIDRRLENVLTGP